MRNNTAATGRSLDLHCKPVSIVSKTERKRVSVQLKVCAVNSVGLCKSILNNTILQVAIKQDKSYCKMCSLSCC